MSLASRLVVVLVGVVSTACSSRFGDFHAPVAAYAAAAPAPVAPPAPATPSRPFALYDAEGRPTTFEAFLEGSRDADLVAIGELHGHPVGADFELRTLTALAATGRPLALAMEFFERDVQQALDDYLAGKSAEADFVKATRQSPAYAKTHRPLIEFAKAKGIPVIAANAPRRLVTEYRKGEKPYAEYLSGLSEADRGFLPAETTLATGPYFDRWSKLMGPERGPRLLKGQSLWDDAMADAVATYRAAHPDHRVLLVVGGFHVAGRLGTITKYAERRPGDRVRLMVMSAGTPPDLAFDPADRGEGDLILTVPTSAGP
jgi:uncharacterized iron-regulated protein